MRSGPGKFPGEHARDPERQTLLTAARVAMSIGLSIFLIAVGAILKYAVNIDPIQGVDIQVMGVILMIVGVIGLLVSLAYAVVTGREPGAP